MTLTTYNGYRINQTPLGSFFIQNSKGQDLFYGIETMAKAKQTVDNWNIAKSVLG